ncbi:hypothetical protein ACE6H2_006397 [Prunus campanulata]
MRQFLQDLFFSWGKNPHESDFLRNISRENWLDNVWLLNKDRFFSKIRNVSSNIQYDSTRSSFVQDYSGGLEWVKRFPLTPVFPEGLLRFKLPANTGSQKLLSFQPILVERRNTVAPSIGGGTQSRSSSTGISQAIIYKSSTPERQGLSQAISYKKSYYLSCSSISGAAVLYIFMPSKRSN